MEKISLKDLLSLLLPGFFFFMLLAVLRHLLAPYVDLDINNWQFLATSNEALTTIYVLLGCIIAGAAVHRLSAWPSEGKQHKIYHRLTGLYPSTGKLFHTINHTEEYLSFFNKDCKALFGKPYETADSSEEGEHRKIQGKYFNHVYYYISVHCEHSEGKTQQGFYFLFRNMFTCCLLSGIAGLTVFFLIAANSGEWVRVFLIFFIACLLAGYVVFVPLAVWYRKRMVRYLFFEYYFHCNNKQSA